MIHWLTHALRTYPELAIFLTLGLGSWIGGLKLRGQSLGAVTGTLLVGVLVGQLRIPISPNVKAVFFLLFLFAVGYGVGPQFFRGLKRDGLPQAAFAVIVCVLGLAATWACAIVAGFDAGTAAGLLSGSQTISAVIGVAGDTIQHLDVGADEKKRMVDHIPIAYAVTYIFGTAGTAWILGTLGPRILGVDLKAACREYERKMGGGAEAAGLTAYRMFTVRAYRVRDELAGRTAADVEALFAGHRTFVERIRRGEAIVEVEPATRLEAGDIVALAGRHEALVESGPTRVGPEVDDPALLRVPVEVLDVVLTRADLADRKLGDLVDSPVVRELGRGVFLRRVVRGDVDMPIHVGLALDRGDRLTLVGARDDVRRLAGRIGYPDRVTDETDLVFVGIGVVAGGLAGTLATRVGGVPLSLTTSGGALIAGLALGWLRSTRPTFGRIPASALSLLKSLGLSAFIAVVGISAGPGFLAGFQKLGLSLLAAGIVATTVPMVLGILIGKWVFRFDPAICLGVCAGARVATPALGQVTAAAGSQVPALGYTVPYAVSNTLLIVWGIVIVLLLG